MQTNHISNASVIIANANPNPLPTSVPQNNKIERFLEHIQYISYLIIAIQLIQKIKAAQ